jgi:sulfonate transport system permease protein
VPHSTSAPVPALPDAAAAEQLPEECRGRALPLGLCLPLLALGALELAVRGGWLPAHRMPPPSELGSTLLELAAGELLGHVAVSSARVASGFALGALLGVAVGAAVALHRRSAALLDPSLQALRAIPGLAWVPLLLLWLGIGEAPKLALIAIGAFFPVYANVVAGIQNVDRKWVEVGAIHGLSAAASARRILLPAALPSLFTGLRSGLSLAWMFMVAAELIAASRGVGYLLSDGRETSRPDIVLVAIAVLALLGKLSDSALRALERRRLAWCDVLGVPPR